MTQLLESKEKRHICQGTEVSLVDIYFKRLGPGMESWVLEEGLAGPGYFLVRIKFCPFCGQKL